MKLKLTVLLILISLSLPMLPAQAAVKAGSNCKTAGITSVVSDKTYTCIKSGKKLVWGKGVTIPKTNPTPTSSPKPTPTISKYLESSQIAAATECRLRDFFQSKTPGDDYNNIGFPIKIHELPIKGKINILFLPVAFSDIPATKDETARFIQYKNHMENWFEHITNQQLIPKIQIQSNWINIPESSKNYDISLPSDSNYPKNHQLLANRIIQLSDPFVDYKQIDAVLIYWAGSPTTFQYDLGLRDYEISTAEGKNRIFIWSPGPFTYSDYGFSAEQKRERLWQFYIHEMLHSMGITGHAPAGFETGLGNTVLGLSAAIDSWSAFLAGWTLDEQIYCAPKILLSSSIIFLSPIDKKQSIGKRSIIIPLSEKEAIVVEAREAIDFSVNWPSGTKGIFAFIVDTSKRNDPRNPLPSNSRRYESWSYYLPPKRLVDSGKDLDGITCQDEKTRVGCAGTIRDFREFLATAGDTIEYSGILIELLDYNLDAIIRISRS